MEIGVTVMQTEKKDEQKTIITRIINGVLMPFESLADYLAYLADIRQEQS
jgi:predicted transcriptional regulator